MADAALLSVKRDEQKGKIWSYLRSKVGNYAIGSDDIWNLRFPLPPLDIQKQTVTKILAKRAEITLLRERATQSAGSRSRNRSHDFGDKTGVIT